MEDAWGELGPADQLEPVRPWNEVGPDNLPERAGGIATEVLRRTGLVEDRISGAQQQLSIGQRDTHRARERVHQQPVLGPSRTPAAILPPLLMTGEEVDVGRRQ